MQCISRIDVLSFFDLLAYLDQPSTSRRRSFHEESILNKVSTLLQFEKKWKNQWADTVGASLDAAKIL